MLGSAKNTLCICVNTHLKNGGHHSISMRGGGGWSILEIKINPADTK